MLTENEIVEKVDAAVALEATEQQAEAVAAEGSTFNATTEEEPPFPPTSDDEAAAMSDEPWTTDEEAALAFRVQTKALGNHVPKGALVELCHEDEDGPSRGFRLVETVEVDGEEVPATASFREGEGLPTGGWFLYVDEVEPLTEIARVYHAGWVVEDAKSKLEDAVFYAKRSGVL